MPTDRKAWLTGTLGLTGSLLLTLGLATVSCVAEPPRTPISATPCSNPTPVSDVAFAYGVAYPYASDWGEADRQAIRQSLTYLHNLGVGTVVQVFPSHFMDFREEDWLMFLDEADAAGLEVAARLDRGNPWDGSQFGFEKIQRFLGVVKGHPALVGFVGLHEPMELFSGDQMRLFYATVKGFAPDVPIVSLMGNQIAKAERNPAWMDRRFTDGMCDVCLIYYFPFQEENGQDIFQKETLVDVIDTTLDLVRSRDPDAQVWFGGQAFAPPRHRLSLRMPTGAEMLDLAATVVPDRRVDGLLWYQYVVPGQRPAGFLALGDPEMSEQREAMMEIAELYVEVPR